MVKAIKRKYRAWQAKRHMKWVIANLPAVTATIHGELVYQMWRAGIRFEHINKWRRWRGMNPIVCYVVEKPGEQVRYFPAEPDMEQKRAIREAGRQVVYIK